MKPIVEVYQPTQILSASTGLELMKRVESSLALEQNLFLVDMSNAMFIDSTGLGYLIKSLQQIQAAQGEMYICSLKGQAAMLLELTNMNQAFQIFQDRPQFDEWMLKQQS